MRFLKPFWQFVRVVLFSKWDMMLVWMTCSRILHTMAVREIDLYSNWMVMNDFTSWRSEQQGMIFNPMGYCHCQKRSGRDDPGQDSILRWLLSAVSKNVLCWVDALQQLKDSSNIDCYGWHIGYSAWTQIWKVWHVFLVEDWAESITNDVGLVEAFGVGKSIFLKRGNSCAVLLAWFYKASNKVANHVVSMIGFTDFLNQSNNS